MTDHNGDFDEKPMTPSENRGAGSSADFELTEQPKVHHYRLPPMMKIGQDRLAVGYTSDEKGYKIRTISVLEPITRRGENDDDEQHMSTKKRSTSGIGSIKRGENYFSSLEQSTFELP